MINKAVAITLLDLLYGIEETVVNVTRIGFGLSEFSKSASSFPRDGAFNIATRNVEPMGSPAKDTERYFEEIEEGETYTVEDARTITEADVVNFAGISGDFHPLHMSKTVGENSEFGERIAHGNLVFSVAESLIADMNPRSFSYGYDSLRFVDPVPIGTTLTVRREVLETEDYNDTLGRVVYEYVAEDENGNTVLTCEHITLVEKESAA